MSPGLINSSSKTKLVKLVWNNKTTKYQILVS